MKKIYFTIIASVCMLSANAQLSLTKATTEPSVGDVTSKRDYDSVAVLPKTVGINQVWDFSSLTSTTVMATSTYTTVASTPYSANFPSATVAENDGAGGVVYYKGTTAQYELIGFEDPTTAINFTNTAVVAVWPVSYGYSNSDNFSGTATVNGTLTGTANGTITTLGSGTGTLIIPGGTSFTNILQTKTTQLLNISLAGGLLTSNSVATDYNYYHASQKYPLLTVSYNRTTGTQSSFTAGVKINTAVITGVNDLNFDATFAIFPNPAKNNFTVKLSNAANANCMVEIINMMGKTVQSLNLGSNTEIMSNVSISDLSTGIYVVKTTLGDKSSVRKLIVE
ncbi:MAG: T9SS type A sorting domain-containing protein [Bacteroidetes bacterium]|nr:T9SS type A sorting domain-containing protein [Bacteroidota bacterium]